MAWSSSYFNRMLILLICLGLLFEPALLKAGGCWSKIDDPSHGQRVAGHTKSSQGLAFSYDQTGDPKTPKTPSVVCPEYRPGVRKPFNISTCWGCVISFFCCCDDDHSDDGSQEGMSLVDGTVVGDESFYREEK